MSDHSDHSDGIFLKAHVGFANDPRNVVIEVFDASGVVYDLSCGVIIKEPVDREISSPRVIRRTTKLIVIFEGCSDPLN